MGVTESDIFEAVDLMERPRSTQGITAEQKNELSRVLWDAHDRLNHGEKESIQLSGEQSDMLLSRVPTGPDREANEKIPSSMATNQTSTQQPAILESSMTGRITSSIGSSAAHGGSAAGTRHERSKKAGMPWFSAKTTHKA
jgi:hypothetical protein